MKFSKHTTYGLRAMIQLTKEADLNNEFISLAEISRKEGISKKYLEQIFIKLKKADLVKASQGKQGGYKLAKSPEKINIEEIIVALEGEISPSSCLSGKGQPICEKGGRCGVVLLLMKIQKNVKDILQKTSLRELERCHK